MGSDILLCKHGNNNMTCPECDLEGEAYRQRVRTGEEPCPICGKNCAVELAAMTDERDRERIAHNAYLAEHKALCETVKQLRSDNSRLQGIVDKLPKTADGVPVVPGMVIGKFVGTAYAAGAVRYADLGFDICDLYSTESAARESER